MKSFCIAREALIAVFVCSIFMNTMLMSIPMNKSINKVLADLQNQTHLYNHSSQQFDYLFKCAGVKLISCWDLKEHRIIIIIIKNQKKKISIEFPQYFICLR